MELQKATMYPLKTSHAVTTLAVLLSLATSVSHATLIGQDTAHDTASETVIASTSVDLSRSAVRPISALIPTLGDREFAPPQTPDSAVFNQSTSGADTPSFAIQPGDHLPQSTEARDAAAVFSATSISGSLQTGVPTGAEADTEAPAFEARTVSPPITYRDVPEPSSLVLLATGLFGSTVALRRRVPPEQSQSDPGAISA